MHVILFLNHQCNLRCKYCYNGEKFQAPMDQSMINRGVDLAFSRGDARLTFFGGEPLLEYDNIVYAVNLAKHKAKETGTRLKRFSTTVNGTLLQKEMLEFFKRENFLVVISLDGNREANDENRIFADGSPSYSQIEQGLKLAMAILPSVHVSAVIDPSTVHLLSQSFAHILDLGVRNMSFNFNYDAPWNEDTLAVYKQQMVEISDLYVGAYQNDVPVEYTSFSSKIQSHLTEGYAPSSVCKFGDGEVTLTPSGRLYPCERLVGEDSTDSTLSIGDIEHGVDLQKVLRFAKAKNVPEVDCQACAIVDRCIHFCGCVNYATTGTIGAVSGLLCEVEQTVIAQADRAASTLFKEKNPAFLKKFYKV